MRAAKGGSRLPPDAARAALAGGYAIECDVQMSADGEIMVFHDARLDRLTAATGPLAARSAKELAEIALKKGPTIRSPRSCNFSI